MFKRFLKSNNRARKNYWGALFTARKKGKFHFVWALACANTITHFSRQALQKHPRFFFDKFLYWIEVFPVSIVQLANHKSLPACHQVKYWKLVIITKA